MSEHERTIGSVLEEMEREKERQARVSELGNWLLEMMDVIADDIALKVIERLKEDGE